MRLKTLYPIIGIAAALAIVVGVNMFTDTRLANVRADLTQSHIYTLSDSTKKILRGLKQPVTLRLFYARSLGAASPAYAALAEHVRETLQEYATVSGGKVRVQYLDPVPFSDVEDQALAYGLQGVPLNEGGEKVYFGLAGTNMLDDQRTIPFFQPSRERFLEYDLSKLVYDLSNPERAEVGVISSLPLQGDQREMMMSRGRAGGPYASAVMLAQTNKVQSLPLDVQVIPPKIQVLLVAEAQNLSQATLYAIDQFVMRGGRLMVMVDPWSEVLAGTPTSSGIPISDAHSDLAQLFKAWGIRFDPGQVVGELDGAWQVAASPEDQSAVAYPAWFTVSGAGINHDDPATVDLHQVTVASPGFIEQMRSGAGGGEKISFTPLLKTDGSAGVIAVNQIKLPDPAKVLANFKPDGKSRVIAARIRGLLHSAFSGPPPLAKGQTRPADFPAYIAQTKQPANLVVVADSDILADRFWVQKSDFMGQTVANAFSDNGPFVANLVDTLAGGDALIGLRARGTSVRPFVRIDEMRAGAEAKFRKTEQGLQAHLQEVQKQLQALRDGGGTGQAASPLVTSQQSQAIEEARADILQTRKQLRTVRFDLNRDISRLETVIRVLNIAAVPVLLTIIAIAMGLMRRRRRGWMLHT